ncbi:hypothetical protein [Knoellia aerolata]|uniref:Uncharacterized protein n=1 Tax=Knoellia aerolata DSM 18566 TaxID=1385519 RepID=A0A0A0JVG7_9MICO|nr:hypothetical protein [Knoellia aerolata]KGN41183.1 hypothetical protein N801_08865 [Knoellia aerolata DSM 18566]
MYLLEHQEHRSLKVGVTAQKPLAEPRVPRLCRRYGWCLVGKILLLTGEQAYEVEQSVLRWVRDDLGLPHHLTSAETEGATETFSADMVGVVDVMDKIRAEAQRVRAAGGGFWPS